MVDDEIYEMDDSYIQFKSSLENPWFDQRLQYAGADQWVRQNARDAEPLNSKEKDNLPFLTAPVKPDNRLNP